MMTFDPETATEQLPPKSELLTSAKMEMLTEWALQNAYTRQMLHHVIKSVAEGYTPYKLQYGTIYLCRDWEILAYTEYASRIICRKSKYG